MKGEKVRIAFIYILIIVIIGLIGALIYISVSGDKKETKVKKESNDVFDISEECTFEISKDKYVDILNGNNSGICDNLNWFVINDVVLNETIIDLSVIYYNGVLTGSDTSTGVYIDGKRVVRFASTDYINKFEIFDNKLFVLSTNEDETNMVVYNSEGKKVYDLASSLKAASITDNALVELAKTNPDIVTTVNSENIDVNSMTFADTEFSFSTDSKLECAAGTNSGSTYKVTFSGDEFAMPEFVNFKQCVPRQ